MPIIEGAYCPQCGAEAMSKRTDVAISGNVRFVCRSCKTRTTKPLNEPPQILPKFKKQNTKRFIITSAVNDTPVIDGALKTMEKMANEIGAQLVVIATVYKNPDMVRQGFLQSLSWPSEVMPHICQQEFKINKNLVVRGDARIRVTQINPLAGANHAGGMVSEIYGHPQVAMELVPTPKNSIPKMLISTGTISQQNYGGSFTAHKAKFHHSIGAVLVEVVGDTFWTRQLHWDGEGIQDLHTYYTPTGKKRRYIEGAVYGDIHVDALTKKERSNLSVLMEKLGAKVNVLHDVMDSHTVSHHTEHDVLVKMRNPDFDLRGELNRAVNWLKGVPGKAVVVSSNHDDHVDQWFNRFNPRTATSNLDIYYELAELVRAGNPGGLFELYCQAHGVEADFTNPDVEYDVVDVDVSQHGHRGPNGARGSAKAFARTGRKTIMGHSHTPRIEKGCYQVGTSSMEHAYAKGYSSWAVCHALVYPNGKRTLLFAIKNKFSPMVNELR